jgi:hypothetical protein
VGGQTSSRAEDGGGKIRLLCCKAKGRRSEGLLIHCPKAKFLASHLPLDHCDDVKFSRDNIFRISFRNELSPNAVP